MLDLEVSMGGPFATQSIRRHQRKKSSRRIHVSTLSPPIDSPRSCEAPTSILETQSVVMIIQGGHFGPFREISPPDTL